MTHQGTRSFRGRRARTVGLAVVLAGGSVGALAETAQGQIRWRSSPQDAAPPVMSPAEAGQAILDLAGADGVRHVLVEFDGPVSDAARARLASAGVKLQAFLGNGAFFAAVDPARLDARLIAGVRGLHRAAAIERSHKLHPSFVAGEVLDWSIVGQTMAPDGGDAEPIVAAYVMFHRDVAMERGRAVVAEHHALVRDDVDAINALVIELPYSQVALLADRDEVLWIEPPLPKFSTLNDSVRPAVQADAAQSPPYGLDGSGVVVLVYDAGTALASHADFGGRVTVRDSSGTISHATHVSGTVGGNGAASGGQFAGMAPNCTIESYGFEWSGGSGFLYTNPGDIQSDYSDAINNHGAVISNNSIGSNVESNGFPCDWQGDYGVTASLIDSIVRGSLGAPIRIVWAAGNERQGSFCDVEGFGDFYSIAPPAAAKNHLTVGAMNSNDNSITSFTSWGPTDDGRLKPDLSAPGCQSNGDNGVTSCSSNGGYTTFCGTSMASPATAGCAALLLEDFRAQFPGRPDYLPSTNKALFIQNTLDLDDVGPDYRTGYGLIQVVDTIDFMRTGSFLEGQITQGDTVNFTVNVPPSTPELKVTLAWDDFPATPNVIPSLVNDLDVLVTGPGGTFFPWTLNPLAPDNPPVQTGPDHLNNIEQVVVSNPPEGQWTVSVTGFDVPEGPQSFSLVASPSLVATVLSAVNLPTLVPPGQATTLTLRIDTIGETVVTGSPRLHYRLGPGAFVETPMIDAGGNLYQGVLPAATCSSSVEFYFSAEGSTTGPVLLPASAPASTFTYAIGEVVDFFSDDFETDQGWTVQNSASLTDGPWERGVPAGGDVVPGDRGDPPADADGSGQCYVTDNAPGNSDVDGGSTTLISPIMDATQGNPAISYDRWFHNSFGATPFTEVFVVDVSDDGGASWVNLETVGPAGGEVSGGWFHKEFLLTDIPGFQLTSQFRIRFIAADPDPGAVVEAGVDGVKLTTFQCVDTSIPGDLNGDGVVDVLDLLELLAGWGTCPPPCPPNCLADINSDCTVDVLDLLDLLANWG